MIGVQSQNEISLMRYLVIDNCLTNEVGKDTSLDDIITKRTNNIKKEEELQRYIYTWHTYSNFLLSSCSQRIKKYLTGNVIEYIKQKRADQFSDIHTYIIDHYNPSVRITT